MEEGARSAPRAYPSDLLHLPESLPLPFLSSQLPKARTPSCHYKQDQDRSCSFTGQAPPLYHRLEPSSVLNCPFPSELVTISSLPKAPYYHPLFLPCPHFCLTIPVDQGLPFHESLLQPRFQPHLQYHLVPAKDNQLPCKNKKGGKDPEDNQLLVQDRLSACPTPHRAQEVSLGWFAQTLLRSRGSGNRHSNAASNPQQRYIRDLEQAKA